MVTFTSNLDEPSLYACPKTGNTFEREEGFFLDKKTEQRYPIYDGIPRFLVHSPKETAEESATLVRLNDLAISRGWQDALAQVYGEDSGMYRYVTDMRRATYLDLLPLTSQSVVLEIGTGLGQFTVPIASRSAGVYGLEIVPEQAQFTAIRCRQNGLTNVHLACGGDDCRLPYLSGSFDVVVCSLVIEWCAGRSNEEEPEAMQRRLLMEMERVLKPGGVAYVNTKNRFSLRNLLGGRDEHLYNMRFGNAMPRWLRDLCLAATGRERPRALLHSHEHLRRMARDSGFAEVESYWAAPEMRYPARLVPIDAKSIRAARGEGIVQGYTRLTRLIMPMVPAPLVKHFTPGLTFIAKKSA